MTEELSRNEAVCLPRLPFKSLSGPQSSTFLHLQTTAYKKIMQDTQADTIWADETRFRPMQTLELSCKKHYRSQVHVSLPVPASAISHIQYWCDAGSQGAQGDRLSHGHACKVPDSPYDLNVIKSPACQWEIQSIFKTSVADVYEDNLCVFSFITKMRH